MEYSNVERWGNKCFSCKWHGKNYEHIILSKKFLHNGERSISELYENNIYKCLQYHSHQSEEVQSAYHSWQSADLSAHIHKFREI